MLNTHLTAFLRSIPVFWFISAASWNLFQHFNCWMMEGVLQFPIGQTFYRVNVFPEKTWDSEMDKKIDDSERRTGWGYIELKWAIG